MHSVAISDHAFTYAKRAAADNGQSVEDYLENLIIHDAKSLDEAVGLTPEQVSKVRQGQEDVRARRVFTPEQVRNHLQSKHDAWLQAHPN